MDSATPARREGQRSESASEGDRVLSRFRSRLTYANVMSTLAVFIALGGTSYAAVSLNGKNLKHRSVPGTKLKRNSITNLEVRESRLGRVPRAKFADSLLVDPQSARSRVVTAVELADRCPAATVFAGGTCIESVARKAEPYWVAVGTCGNEPPGRRLPSHGELVEALKAEGVELTPGGELTSHIYPSARPAEPDVLYVADQFGRVALTTSVAGGGERAYRCAVDPTNR